MTRSLMRRLMVSTAVEALLITLLVSATSVEGRQPVKDERLVRAVADHLTYSVGFRTKLKTGTYATTLKPDSAEARQQAQQVLGKIVERLGRFPTHERAKTHVALIHHVTADKKLEIWLIGAKGVIAKGTSNGPYEGLGTLESSLNVLTRAAGYTPTKRGQKSVQQQAPGPTQSPDDALLATSNVLFTQEVKKYLSSESGRLLVLPARDTGTAPYAAFPLLNGQRLVERWSVVVMPDIETLADSERVFKLTRFFSLNAVVVGDPDLSADTTFKWPKLPGARAEALAIGNLLSVQPSRVLVGAAATKKRVIAALLQSTRTSIEMGTTGLIYIASHGVADSVNPMDGSFVALTGGHLYGRDLRDNRFIDWGAFHPLVVLSACQTGLGKVFDGGDYGIVQGWVKAGAAQVVASLWRVRDDATQILMTRFVEVLSDVGLAPEEALRVAQRDAAKRFSEDPGAWASFTVFGAPSDEIIVKR